MLNSNTQELTLKHLIAMPLVAVTLSLAACNDPEEVPVEPVAEETAAVMDDAYPVGAPLNEQQQTNYDAMDRDAITTEYQTNRSAMMAEGAGSGMNNADMSGDSMATSSATASNDMSGSGDTAMSGSDNAMASSGTSSSGAMSGLRPRGQMDFAYLDRNSDGKLSVAEYAIWAVRADPTEPKPNDNTRPFISPEQINEAGQTFFSFDQDGDTYLQQGEFDAARASARTP